MRVLVTAEDRLEHTSDAHVWAPVWAGYGFLERYLTVFDEVRVVARIRDAGWAKTARADVRRPLRRGTGAARVVDGGSLAGQRTSRSRSFRKRFLSHVPRGYGAGHGVLADAANVLRRNSHEPCTAAR
jgi:hypothetical protein